MTAKVSFLYCTPACIPEYNNPNFLLGLTALTSNLNWDVSWEELDERLKPETLAEVMENKGASGWNMRKVINVMNPEKMKNAITAIMKILIRRLPTSCPSWDW